MYGEGISIKKSLKNIGILFKHIFIFLLWFVGFPLLFLLVLDQETAYYFNLIIVSLGTLIHMLYLLFFKELIKEKRDNSLYSWLDNRSGNDVAKEILGIDYNVKGETLDILEVTQKKILFYVNNDINKLQLLKAYLESKNKDNLTNRFVRILLPILSVIIISFLAEDNFIGRVIFSPTNDLEFINKNIVDLIKYIFMIFSIIIFLVIILYEMYKGQRRNTLLKKIIDVCIKKLET